jgi:hypothetical protein
MTTPLLHTIEHQQTPPQRRVDPRDISYTTTSSKGNVRRTRTRTYELLSIVSVEIGVKVVVSQSTICLSDILENYARVPSNRYQLEALHLLRKKKEPVEKQEEKDNPATHPGGHRPLPIAQPDDPRPLDPPVPVGLFDRV